MIESRKIKGKVLVLNDIRAHRRRGCFWRVEIVVRKYLDSFDLVLSEIVITITDIIPDTETEPVAGAYSTIHHYYPLI